MKDSLFFEMLEDFEVDVLTRFYVHAVEEHSYVEDELLKNRIRVERVRGASCFSKDTDIRAMIVKMVRNSAKILVWLDSDRKEDFVIKAKKADCGKKFLNDKSHNWSNGALPCDTIVLILGKRFDKAGCLEGFYVKTCYPE